MPHLQTRKHLLAKIDLQQTAEEVVAGRSGLADLPAQMQQDVIDHVNGKPRMQAGADAIDGVFGQALIQRRKLELKHKWDSMLAENVDMPDDLVTFDEAFLNRLDAKHRAQNRGILQDIKQVADETEREYGPVASMTLNGGMPESGGLTQTKMTADHLASLDPAPYNSAALASGRVFNVVPWSSLSEVKLGVGAIGDSWKELGPLDSSYHVFALVDFAAMPKEDRHAAALVLSSGCVRALLPATGFHKRSVGEALSWSSFVLAGNGGPYRSAVIAVPVIKRTRWHMFKRWLTLRRNR